MKLLDCTLRDGANVFGKGFSREMTDMMLRGLVASNIKTIEMGNANGIGSYQAGSISPLTDEEYLALAKPYLSQAEIGMFLNISLFSPQRPVDAHIECAAREGLHFLRVGANAGSARKMEDAIRRVKAAGLKCYCSIMKCGVVKKSLVPKCKDFSEMLGSIRQR